MFWLALIIRPFVLLAFLTCLLFVRYLVIWFMPECKLKRVLLIDV
jgi:hypothetical protein